jgi:hypothetical protein
MSDSTSSPALKNKKMSEIRGLNLPLAEVDLGNLENEVGESSADTLDGSKGEHGLAFTVDVCVLDSENVREFFSLDELDRL